MVWRLHFADCVCTGARPGARPRLNRAREISLRPVDAIGSQTREHRQASSATLRRHHRMLSRFTRSPFLGRAKDERTDDDAID
jgi:hypothetical protein